MNFYDLNKKPLATIDDQVAAHTHTDTHRDTLAQKEINAIER